MPADHVYALLADGTTVGIRPPVPADFDAVKTMHQAMSPGNTYMRFFNISRGAAETEARRITAPPGQGQAALLAVCGPEVVGVASYVELREQQGTAEISFAVADHMHHKGIATLLLEHLVSLASSQHIETFTAQTLTDNQAMLSVFTAAGLPVRRRYAEGVIELTFPLPADGPGQGLDSYLTVVAERERRSDAASLRHMLAPESVAVVGASRRPGTVGRVILDNIRAAGYAGRLYPVNRTTGEIDGERVPSSVLELPEPVDLAVIAVPGPAVLEVAGQCGQHGVRALAVVASGLDEAACASLLAVCRRYGMRLIGPDSFGLAVPGIGLAATFAAAPPRPGVAGLVMQSGGLGLAAVDRLSRLGIGISSFASVGPKLDVSSNDMLLWWEGDSVTRVAVLYIDSFGNPRKFARTARRVGVAMPVLTVLAGSTETAPLISQEALFEQAGVITTRGFGELIEATALLASQPVPAGRTVAIVSNVGSAARLAGQTCASLGLTVRHPIVYTAATVSAEEFRRQLELLAPEVDAIIAIVLPTGATGDLCAAVQQADVGVPLAAVLLDQPDSVRLLPGARGQVPVYGYPEAAVGALARAARYGAWRAEPRGHLPGFPEVRAADARALVRDFLGRAPDGDWLPDSRAAALLRCYGITLGPASGDGTDVTVRVTADRVFGPLVVFGLAGVAAELFEDQAARLTPLTDTDADTLIRSVRAAPLLLGYRGRPAADLDALRDLLLRLARLADDLPEVAELDLTPVQASPQGAYARRARVRLVPAEPADPFLRRLR